LQKLIYENNQIYLDLVLFNPNGRVTPDISALGDVNFEVIVNGHSSQEGGTSAAVPTVAAFATLLNQGRLKQGKTPLGFLNPLLYHIATVNPEAYYDVGVGSNAITCQGCPGLTGFISNPGFDPVSGLGTPDFVAFEKIIQQLP